MTEQNKQENELREYENSLKAYRDIKNCVDSAKQEGRAEVAPKLLTMGMSVEDIAKATNLSIDEVKSMR